MIKQALILTIIGLKSSLRRMTMALICIFSIATVAAVFLGLLALTDGMSRTMKQSGAENTLLVMRQGAATELQSVMFPAEVKILSNHSAIVRDDGNQPLISAELFVSAEYKGSAAGDKSLSLRGIGQRTVSFRPNFELSQGRMFKPGLRQVIVGQAITRKYPEIKVGNTIKLGSSEWQVSGIFTDNNSVFESEIWADLAVVQNDYQRGSSVQSIRLALVDNTDVNALLSQWQADPRLNIRGVLEKAFFAAQGEDLTRLIRWIGFPVALVMAIGAVVSALNTMYAIVASRSKEIATQKAIGFSPFAVSFAITSEAIFLSLLGALAGILPMFLAFDGWTASTKNAASLSQLVFNFSISSELMLQTLFACTIIGILGGILPAFRVMRLPVTAALAK